MARVLVAALGLMTLLSACGDSDIASPTGQQRECPNGDTYTVYSDGDAQHRATLEQLYCDPQALRRSISSGSSSSGGFERFGTIQSLCRAVRSSGADATFWSITLIENENPGYATWAATGMRDECSTEFAAVAAVDP